MTEGGAAGMLTPTQPRNIPVHAATLQMDPPETDITQSHALMMQGSCNSICMGLAVRSAARVEGVSGGRGGAVCV